MKDLRDLMSLIEEGQYAFDDSHPHFEGVWDSFKKISNLSVPDAVIAPSPDLVRFNSQRRNNQKPPATRIHDAMMAKDKSGDWALFNREGGPGGNPGGDDDED